MHPASQHYLDTELSEHVTVKQCHEMFWNKQKDAIADFILARFTERYIAPLRDTTSRHGFCIMAVCCLMIETLVAFREGLEDTKDEGERVFTEFFKAHNGFGLSRDSDIASFYTDIRCGLLHQAEARNGWRIVLEEVPKAQEVDPELPAVDINRTVVRAEIFLDKLEDVLKAYCDELKAENYERLIWQNLRKKMDSICRNCGEYAHDEYFKQRGQSSPYKG